MFSFKKFKGKTAGVIGLGKSGQAAAKFLYKQGFKVILADSRHLPLPVGLDGIEVFTGGFTEQFFDCDFFVKSPGISNFDTVIQKIKALKKPIFSEVEIALAFVPKSVKVFAVTGTNGKSTTTVMLGEILKEHVKEIKTKQKVYVAGNIGTPLTSYADKIEENSLIVLEVSSYQLEDSTYFKPFCSALLNITPDHLDHHGGIDNYILAKSKVFKQQGKDDFFITNGGDSVCVSLIKKAKSHVLTFSSEVRHSVRVDVFYDGDELIFSSGAHLKPPKLLVGIHNIENAMAASLMAFAGGVSQKAVQKGFDIFNCLEHRIEYFAEFKGIKCYNDSKATNIESTIPALKSFGGNNNIWLILGGRHKGSPYAPLLPYLQKYCKQAVLIGESSPIIKQDLGPYFPVVEKGDLKHAVEYIFSQAKRGDILLLSPACSSFDQFKDFEDRGRKFKKIVQNYIKSKKK